MPKKNIEMTTKERLEAGYRNVSEFCEIVGIDRETFYYHQRQGSVPTPTTVFQGQRRKFYTPSEVLALVAIYKDWSPYADRKQWGAAFDEKCKAAMKKGGK